MPSDHDHSRVKTDWKTDSIVIRVAVKKRIEKKIRGLFFHHHIIVICGTTATRYALHGGPKSILVSIAQWYEINIRRIAE